ncbi:MAG: MBL fold metallo-hydrolase [Melioribacteraceae bacterium]|nr:MBL fold metallo-hydrolase [Melioribacteraceae bacterium]MCF8354762.1 MBL fold metallo-hydrolase [Melioribacteraceae bacterium]MCF8394387.1 MBL fold metallo-hydrolase [Melioribacteraceae bacterium]MCF8417517.1 MBL fold metallo-hydrolase [Melioribacteraceae bacterium]
MKTDRRKFLKNGLLTAIGTLFIPAAFKENDIKAGSAYSLNYKPNPNEWKDNEISISWIGHSTVLINFYGKWIITDPVLFNRVGVYLMGTSIGPTRLTPPALTIDEIPKPDIVLLSHAHMDHCDYPTLKAISKKYPDQIDIITAYLTKDVFEDLPWKSITVLDWEEEAVVNDIHFKALEVKHFGWRFPWEKDRSRGFMKDGRSYNAYLINYNNKKILFGGDTADTDKLNRIKNESVDIALMPIGAYNPWKRAHCNPEEALRMADDINAKFFIPMHCKTFQQGKEPFHEPTNWLKKSVVNYNVKLGLDEIGQTFTI